MLGRIMVGIQGQRLDSASREVLLHPAVGGVILFSRNFESPEQVTELCAEIRALRTPRLLIAVDQEGGRVQRFRVGYTRLPATAGLGEIYDRNPARACELAQTSGWLMAAELRATGVDISFAPVLDLGGPLSRVIGDRAFHTRPEVIATLTRAYVEGMHEAGMAATGKHFPGHGSVQEDSHWELPRDPRPLEAMRDDLYPFERLMESGLDGMMMAHVIYSELDAQPASFSRVWVTEFLRQRYGFDGAIFSDDLGMAAADCVGDYRARAEAALAAGCDMALLCNQLDQLDAVLAVGQGTAAASRRIEAMLGQPAPSLGELRSGARWQTAVAAVREYDPDSDAPQR